MSPPSVYLFNPNRYEKANPGVRGRGDNGKSGTRNRTRVTATRLAAAAIMGKQQAKQLCQRCKAAGRVGQEHADHKGVCPHAVDTTSMTMADAIDVSSESEADLVPESPLDASELVLELCVADNVMAAATASAQDPEAGAASIQEPGPHAKRPRRVKGKGKGRA